MKEMSKNFLLSLVFLNSSKKIFLRLHLQQTENALVIENDFPYSIFLKMVKRWLESFYSIVIVSIIKDIYISSGIIFSLFTK